MTLIAKNRRASYDYVISDTYIAGLVLTGTEVKSARSGHVSLKGAFCHINVGEVWLRGAQISAYQNAAENHDPYRERKLLLTKSQIEELAVARQKSMTIVPLKMFTKHGHIKLEIGIGRGRKKHDKRQKIRARDDQKRAERITKAH